MRNKNNVLLGSAILTLVCLMISCQEQLIQEEVERPVKIIVLGDSTSGLGRSFPGTTRAVNRAELSFRVSGPLVELPITEGQQVRKGQLLAQIDPRDFRTSVRNLEANLASLEAERRGMNQARPEDIRRLEANLAAVKAGLLEAEATFRRYQRLYENENISKAEYDQRRAARDVAVAELDRAEQELKIGRQGSRAEDIEAMDARIRGVGAQLQQAKDLLEDTSLRAPYQGRIAQRFVDNFEFIQAQQPVISLQNISVIEVIAQVPETVVALARRSGDEDLGRSSDLEFFAQFPSLPELKIPAALTEVAGQADPVTRTFAVTFQIPQPEKEGLILAGMTGEIHAEMPGDAALGYSVPVAAIFADEGGNQCVWKLQTDTMTTQKAKVEIDQLVGGNALILGGVVKGDTIVTAGASFLEEGQTVRPIVDELRERR